MTNSIDFKTVLEQCKNLIDRNQIGKRVRFDDFKVVANLDAKKIEETMKEIIVKGDSQNLNYFSEIVAIGLKCSGVKMNRIRNIFGYIKKVEINETGKQGDLSDETVMRLNLLLPKISYLIGRAEPYEKQGLDLVKQCIEKGVSLVNKNREYFKNFNYFFEAVISYFRFYYK